MMTVVVRKYIFVIFMVLVAFLAGCNKEPDFYDVYEEDTTVIDVVDENYVFDVDFEAFYKDADISEDFLQTGIEFSDEAMSEFEAYLDGVKVVYPYEDKYNIDSTLAAYRLIDKSSDNFDNIFVNGEISPQVLYELVSINNKDVLKKYLLPENMTLRLCEMVCKVVNDYVKSNPEADLNLLSEKLLLLKTGNILDFGFGTYGIENGLMINENLLKGDNPENVSMEETVYHEVFHLIQSDILRDYEEYSYGFCHKFKDLPGEINTLNLTWFVEGAAECMTRDYLGSELDASKAWEGFYTDLIRRFELIKAATLIDSKTKLHDFENLSTTDNLEALFEYFDCKNEDDKREVLAMMFAMEVNTDLNQVSESNLFFEKNPEINAYSEEVKKAFEGSICKTLSKQFYENLVSLSGVTVKDIFSLISIYENEISRFTWYETNLVRLQDFFDTYNGIQLAFFELMSEQLGMSAWDIADSYSAFNAYNTVDAESLDFLPEDKRDYYGYMIDIRKRDKKESINIMSTYKTRTGE